MYPSASARVRKTWTSRCRRPANATDTVAADQPVVFAIRALIIGREEIVGPDGSAPEPGLLQNGMRALAPTIILGALIVMSGYLRHPNNMVMLILIVLFLLMSSAYWTWAIVKYRETRQKESGK